MGGGEHPLSEVLVQLRIGELSRSGGAWAHGLFPDPEPPPLPEPDEEPLDPEFPLPPPGVSLGEGELAGSVVITTGLLAGTDVPCAESHDLPLTVTDFTGSEALP